MGRLFVFWMIGKSIGNRLTHFVRNDLFFTVFILENKMLCFKPPNS